MCVLCLCVGVCADGLSLQSPEIDLFDVIDLVYGILIFVCASIPSTVHTATLANSLYCITFLITVMCIDVTL